MVMFCPTCHGPLQAATPVTAKCSAHPGVFRILFQRRHARRDAAAPAPASLPVPVVARPVALPIPAAPALAPPPALPPRLAAAVPATALPQGNPQWSARPIARPAAPGSETLAFGAAPLGPAPAPPVPARPAVPLIPAAAAPETGGPPCWQHREVEAVWICDRCSTNLCETCAFEMPSGAHLCPSCAVAPHKAAVSRRRVVLAVSAYALPGVAVVLFFVLIAVAAASRSGESAVFAGVVGILAFVPAIAGLGLSVAAIERRLPNPFWIWGAVALNGLAVGGFLLLAVVGTFAK